MFKSHQKAKNQAPDGSLNTTHQALVFITCIGSFAYDVSYLDVTSLGILTHPFSTTLLIYIPQWMGSATP